MTDTITIPGIEVECVIGTHERERLTKRKVIIDISVHGDYSAAARSDSIEDALDYEALTGAVIRAAEGSSFNLIEALAGAIADLVLAEPRADSVDVTVTKPGAVRGARAISVHLRRKRYRS